MPPKVTKAPKPSSTKAGGGKGCGKGGGKGGGKGEERVVVKEQMNGQINFFCMYR